MDVFCPECGRQGTLTSADWRCHCGGAWEPQGRYDLDAQLIDESISSLWRYRRLLGPDFVEPRLSLSAGWTPLVQLQTLDRSIWLKLDFLTLTGSFKDRGTELMMNVLVGEGVARIADGSSGNAGASLAAYAASTGIWANIFVPSPPRPLLAPVAEALEAGLDHVPALEPRGTSIAEDLAIASPVRGKRLLQAIRESDGLCVTVQEHEITRVHGQLAHRGLFVEPTSATAFATLDVVAEDLQPDDTIVIVLTGSGLKGSPVGI
jgi:threonine synthase